MEGEYGKKAVEIIRVSGKSTARLEVRDRMARQNNGKIVEGLMSTARDQAGRVGHEVGSVKIKKPGNVASDFCFRQL